MGLTRSVDVARFIVQPVTDVLAITDQVLGLHLDHVEVKSRLHMNDFMMVRRMSADAEWQSLAINYIYNPLPCHVRPDPSPPPLTRAKVVSIKHSDSSSAPSSRSVLAR